MNNVAKRVLVCQFSETKLLLYPCLPVKVPVELLVLGKVLGLCVIDLSIMLFCVIVQFIFSFSVLARCFMHGYAGALVDVDWPERAGKCNNFRWSAFA